MSNTNLTREKLQQLLTAYRELNTGTNSTLVEANRTFLSAAFIEHAPEFFGAWLAVADEYEPLVHAFAALQSRAAGLNAMRMQQRADNVNPAYNKQQRATDATPGSDNDNTRRIVSVSEERDAIREAVAKSTNVIVMPTPAKIIR